MADKIIPINGEDIKFKVTGGTPIQYLGHFGHDFIVDFMELQKQEASGGITNFLPFYRIAWITAKQADKEIPNMEEWLDSFEDGFPVFEVVEGLVPLIQANFKTSLPVKPKKK
ncbi:hypothetical protein ACIQGW_15960 [Lysinibacillus xylanilyticus]|uniref:hypothetical protein n=1 Tax=Lysinibacillus xylanilyticus TaxID=582475 RepID=UPI00382D38CC